MKKPILIVTLGFPGSGKSYFSERLAKEKNFVHLNSDKTRYTIFPVPTYSKEETRGVFHILELITAELLSRGVSVIYDVNVNARTDRKRLAAIAKRHGANHALVWIKTEVPVAEKRLIKRSNQKKKSLLYPPVSVEILHKMKGLLEHRTKSEPVIAIDGHAPFAQQLKQLRKAVKL